MNVSMLEAAQEVQSAILHEMHLDTGMTAPVLGQKRRERVLDHHRGRADPQDAGVAALEGSSSRIERIGFHQEPTALPKQIFAV